MSSKKKSNSYLSFESFGKSSSGTLKRQQVRGGDDITLADVQDMKQREAIFGLTVGIDFVSLYEQNKALRKLKKEENKELTKYEGKIPVNQRLVLLAADFMEATKDVDHYEMFKWRSNLNTAEKEEH